MQIKTTRRYHLISYLLDACHQEDKREQALVGCGEKGAFASCW